MFDVFNEEIEHLIKTGLSNLYWYRNDLKKAWLRSGVDIALCTELFSKTRSDGRPLSKRELMDALYLALRNAPYNKRLEISRNFARILIEHEYFIKQDPKHEVEKAEIAALRLREIHRKQQEERDNRRVVKRHIQTEPHKGLTLEELNRRFADAINLEPQRRGYELQAIFTDLMRLSGIEVHEPFRIIGEQIDGAIKYDGFYYLVELKWTKNRVNQADIASLYLKVEGKLDSTRGIFIAMNGYSDEVLQSLATGKNLKVLLFDGMHLANVLAGLYSFPELLDSAIQLASLRGIIYCSPTDVLNVLK